MVVNFFAKLVLCTLVLLKELRGIKLIKVKKNRTKEVQHLVQRLFFFLEKINGNV